VSDLDDLLKTIPVGDIASQLGVDEATAGAAVAQAVPTLLAGLQAKAESDDSGDDVAQAADAGDGDAVIKGLFGDKTDDVAHAAAGQAPEGVSSDLIKKVMPMLAPLVIAFVTQKLLGGKGGAQQQAGGAGGALGQILGGALGGNAGGGLGSILGGMLGGGAQQQSGGAGGAGGALGSILGGLLGGKK